MKYFTVQLHENLLGIVPSYYNGERFMAEAGILL